MRPVRHPPRCHASTLLPLITTLNLLFEDDLVEAVVQLTVQRQPPVLSTLQIHRFHADRERAYHCLEPDARTAAFAQAYLTWFCEWQLDRPLREAVSPFDGLSRTLEALAFRRARGRQDEGGELYGEGDHPRRGVVALRPERWTTPPFLLALLHHELAHLADLVDPAFNFNPDTGLIGRTVSEQRLIRDRYRLLWNIRIDGLLHRRGLPALAEATFRRNELNRGFAFLSPGQRETLFHELWSGQRQSHADLMERAADPRDQRGHAAPVPGGPCPLCGFAAFAWADPLTLDPKVRARIQSEFPTWNHHQGICARCTEIYQAIAHLQYPTTICL